MCGGKGNMIMPSSAALRIADDDDNEMSAHPLVAELGELMEHALGSDGQTTFQTTPHQSTPSSSGHKRCQELHQLYNLASNSADQG